MFKKLLRDIMNEWTSRLVDESVPIDHYKVHPGATVSNRKSMSANLEHSNGMNFTVYNAIGGKVIQFSQFDPVRDRTSASLYVITDKEDLGEELGQIITKESLSR